MATRPPPLPPGPPPPPPPAGSGPLSGPSRPPTGKGAFEPTQAIGAYPDDELDLGDQLSDEEASAIQALLRQGLPEPEPGDVVGAASVRGPSEPIVLRYDLIGGGARKSDDLPGLQLLHERFATELSNEFRRSVGSEGAIFPERVSHGKFAEFYARIPLPTALLIATMHGVGCSVIIAMEPPLALHFVDLLMGGEGGLVQIRGDLASRGFTQAEKGIFRHVLAIFARAMKTAWAEITEVDLELTRVATDPRHAAIYEPSEAMVELAVRVEWGEVGGHVRLTIPTSFLGQFEDALSRTATPNHLKAELVNVEQMRRNLAEVEVQLSVILGRAELNLERLLTLEPGDVLRLDSDPDKPCAICVEEVPKLYGYPTLLHGNIAVEVAEIGTAPNPRDAALEPPARGESDAR
jgi:flagellar motor switch protein FliM